MHREQLQIGHSDRLQVDVTEATKCLSFRKGENPSFLKVYAGCSIDRSTYIHRLQYRQGTYIHELQHIQVTYLLVFVGT
jgi:hypothetical protein